MVSGHHENEKTVPLSTVQLTEQEIDLSRESAVEEKSTPVANAKEIGVSVRAATDDRSDDDADPNAIIVTGVDAAKHLLPLRDDGDAALTFRSIVLATGLAGFQATVYQIYNFKPTQATIQGTFIVLIAYFAGKAWSLLLPRGDIHYSRWQSRGGQGRPPAWIRFLQFINNGSWSLKEHSICAITATSASNAAVSSYVFAAQKIFYDMPLNASTVILSTLSIGMFGYGLCGLLRPITVWHVEAVYWTNLPVVKTLQGLHWDSVKDSKPLRYFWYAFAGMFVWEFFPAYIWPWLDSISIPCLASMHATGNTASVLTNLFGGASNNEGLGLFSISLDWQYITSAQTAMPLVFQAHQAVGLFICFIAMLAIYYSNTWNAKNFPFMSTSLRSQDGSKYPTGKVFAGGVLNAATLAKYGVPSVTGSFAWAIFCANAAIGALIAHCIFFWGGDVVRTIKDARQGRHDDRHHEHMAKHYKEVPWWWYAGVLLVSFIFGLIVAIKDNISLPVWAYIVSLLLGIVVAPFSTLLYSRYGNGIATNNLSKMIAGLTLPGRPVGNMYFASWSHNVILACVNLSGDLKMGEYLKIPPRVMFLTQIWGTVFGGFINYVVMISIVNSNQEVLANGNGNASWSGAVIQAYNTNAQAWALAQYLYKYGQQYFLVPMGVLIGFGLVLLHRIFAQYVPKIGRFSLFDLNLAILIQFAGYIPYNQSQTSPLFSWIIAGFFVQYYLRNYRPRLFKDYSYIVTAAFDGAALTVLFILSFAVFGAGGVSAPFPQWWGNNVNGNYDLCPVPDS